MPGLRLDKRRRGVARAESEEIALIEHTQATLSEIQECISFIAARRRLCRADSKELIRIGNAAYRARSYQEELRARLSTAYQNGKHG
jgi:hypothetical protein